MLAHQLQFKYIQTHTHTHRTACCTWTTELVVSDAMRSCEGAARLPAEQLHSSTGRLHPVRGRVQRRRVLVAMDRRGVVRRVPGHRLAPAAAAATRRRHGRPVVAGQ